MLKFVLVATLFVTCAWCYYSLGYDSIVAALVAFTALIYEFAKKKKDTSQNQSIKDKGIGLQAGGDINIQNSDFNK